MVAGVLCFEFQLCFSFLLARARGLLDDAAQGAGVGEQTTRALFRFCPSLVMHVAADLFPFRWMAFFLFFLSEIFVVVSEASRACARGRGGRGGVVVPPWRSRRPNLFVSYLVTPLVLSAEYKTVRFHGQYFVFWRGGGRTRVRCVTCYPGIWCHY